MAYKQFLAGWVNKVLAVGRVAYGGDGTDLYPLNVDSDGQLQVDVLTQAALIAGTARIGTTSGVLKEVRVTKVLLAAAGYTAGDVLSETATDTEGTAWTFAEVARANGGYGYITGAMVVSESENITPRLTLLLFNATPTGEMDDNIPNTSPVSADLAKFVGAIDFPALNQVLATSDSWAIASPSTVGNLPLAFKCGAAADDLFGILVTRDAFTQETGDDMTVVIFTEQY